MLAEFLKYSKKIGQSPTLCQGAGGNSSVKINGLLYVKASGYFLKDLAINKGYVCCDYNKLVKSLKKIKNYSPKLELAFSETVNGTLIKAKSFGSPSIEISLHAAIPAKYIFHTHSTFANIFNFAQNGEKILKKILTGQSVMFIRYSNPGLELGRNIHKKISELKTVPKIIFLKNHGLITCAETAEEAYQLTMFVQEKIKSYLKQCGVKTQFKIFKKTADLSRHLFPDSVVYSQIDFKLLPNKKRQVYYEICSVINFIQSTLKKLKLKPVYLSPPRVNFLMNMEQEKLRIKMLINQ